MMIGFQHAVGEAVGEGGDREARVRPNGPRHDRAVGDVQAGVAEDVAVGIDDALDGVGNPLTMIGFKLVKDDAGFDVWKDTTTLFTRILQGHVPEGGDELATVLASGTIMIRARDFAKQLTTFRAGGPSVPNQLGALTKFGVIFVQQLAEAYLRKGPRARVSPQG